MLAPRALVLSSLVCAPPALAQSYAIQSLSAPNPSINAQLGWANAIDGTTLIAGAPRHFGPGLVQGGTAYVYERGASGDWSDVQELARSQAASHQWFGHAVDLDGELAVVGAPGGPSAIAPEGAAYVYARQPGGGWSELARLSAGVAGVDDDYGQCVAVEGDHVYVGAPGALVGGLAAGAVYVYERQADNSFALVAELVAFDAAAGDRFGHSLDVSSQNLVIGVPGDDDVAAEAGSVYWFPADGPNAWVLKGKLYASNAAESDEYGTSLALEGTRLLVGAELADQVLQFDAGAAYALERTPTGFWSERDILASPQAVTLGRFGSGVALEGDRALIGAPLEFADGIGASGRAYLYEWDSSDSLQLRDEFVSPDPPSSNGLGRQVALEGGWVVAGSFADSSAEIQAGVVELYWSYANTGLPGPSFAGFGTKGCDGPQNMGVNTAPLLGAADFALTCSAAPRSAQGFLLLGGAADLGGIDLLGLGLIFHVDVVGSGPSFLVLPMGSDASGTGSVNLPLPSSPQLAGQLVHAQAVWAWTSCTLSQSAGLSSSDLASLTLTAP